MSDMNRNMEGREAKEILDSILADYELDRTIDKMEDFYDQPNKEVIIDIIEKFVSAGRLQKFPSSVQSWMENAGSRLKKKVTRLP